MARIIIVSCKRIQDVTCVSCIKCFKAVREKAGEFARYEGDLVEVVALSDCGDCPGLILPKMGLVNDMLKVYGESVDAIHLGACIVKAVTTAKCPLELDDVKKKLESKFGLPVVVGTHPW